MSNYKFKKGDRVRNVLDNGYVKVGATGTVDEDHSEVPFVKWDNGERCCQHENNLELITDEKPEDHSGDVNEMIEPNTREVIYGPREKKEFLPGPVVKSDVAPQPNTLEWWRWHFAGLAMQGVCSNEERAIAFRTTGEVAQMSVGFADALIAELQKKGGES